MLNREPLFEELIVYLRLARACREKMETLTADKMLLLGGVCASLLGLIGVARFCRQQIVGHNPGHRLARSPDFTSALVDPDFAALLTQTAKKYPPDLSAEMLARYNQHFPWQRPDFPSDSAMAAAALGVDAEWLEDCFGAD